MLANSIVPMASGKPICALNRSPRTASRGGPIVEGGPVFSSLATPPISIGTAPILSEAGPAVDRRGGAPRVLAFGRFVGSAGDPDPGVVEIEAARRRRVLRRDCFRARRGKPGDEATAPALCLGVGPGPKIP